MFMKRIMAAVLAVGMFLPLLAAPASCDSGTTALKLFANPECLDKYGITIPN
jgi:hypothetical protein